VYSDMIPKSLES